MWEEERIDLPEFPVPAFANGLRHERDDDEERAQASASMLFPPARISRGSMAMRKGAPGGEVGGDAGVESPEFFRGGGASLALSRAISFQNVPKSPRRTAR